jgi:hypothetical protein
MVEMNAMICINIIFQVAKSRNQYSRCSRKWIFSLNGNKIAMQIDIETPFRQQIFIYDIKTATYQQTKGEVP